MADLADGHLQELTCPRQSIGERVGTHHPTTHCLEEQDRLSCSGGKYSWRMPQDATAATSPLLDAKRRIVANALRMALFSIAMVGILNFLVLMAWLNQRSTDQHVQFPTLGLPSSTALAIVSICAAIILGVVLTDQSSRNQAGIAGPSSFHRQASAIIFGEIVTSIAVTSSVAGASAVVGSLQLMVTNPPSIPWAELLTAAAAAAVSWVFILLATSATRTPFEIRAAAAQDRELLQQRVTARVSWLSRWAPGVSMASDDDIQSALRAGKGATLIGTLWIGLISWALLSIATWLIVGWAPGKAFWLALIPIFAHVLVRRALANLVNHRLTRAIGALIICILVPCTVVGLLSSAPFTETLALAAAVAFCSAVSATATFVSWKRLIASTPELGPFPILRDGNWTPTRALALSLRRWAARQQLREIRIGTLDVDLATDTSDDEAIRRYLGISSESM